MIIIIIIIIIIKIKIITIARRTLSIKWYKRP